eukprot:NODE_8310_length_389_cov_263.368263.p3 GENE.NODE_8310_length_389_cov_263.368263~~NODE_8310_length_389_cov_263.368263.p3  ORF type:complete len:52 (+),score=4.37 NODE_8310_length_389_cov_263.368263:219-374(+)
MVNHIGVITHSRLLCRRAAALHDRIDRRILGKLTVVLKADEVLRRGPRSQV